jgi:hypothetical protein
MKAAMREGKQLNQSNDDLKPEVVPAVLDEMLFWNLQLDEHARLIRSGVDLGEDKVFREADQYVGLYDCLMNLLRTPGINTNPLMVKRALRQTKALAAGLREFKMEVENGIAECRIKAMIPADLVNHIRRELDFFIGNLDAVTGGPIPTWEDLGLDHSNRKVSLVPRMLLDELQGQAVCRASLEEMLFWLHISEDHAKLLAGYFKPIEQAQFTQDALQYGAEFERLYQLTFQGRDQRGNLPGLMHSAAELNQSWLNYLLELNRMLATCQIPGRQINLWPALGVHIYREQGYFQSVLLVLQPKAHAENC